MHDGEDFVVNLIKNTDDLSKLTGKDLVTANQQAREAAIAHNATLKQQTLSAKAATVAMNALSAVGNMIAFALIAKGVQLASDAIDHYVNRSKYAAEAMEEAQQEINDSQNKLKEMSSVLSENKDRFLELSQGVDKFSNNLRLSSEDYAEYLSISNQLAELFPSLVSGYDKEGNALLAIGSNADETNKKLQSLLETQQAAAQQTLIDNMNDVANGIYFEVEDAENSISGMETELNSLQQKYKKYNIDLANSDGVITFNDDDYSKYGKAMEDALTSAGIEFKKNAAAGLYHTSIELESASPHQLAQAQEFYDAWMEAENEYFHASENGLKQDIETKRNEIDTFYSKMTPNLQAWVKDNYNYEHLSDSSAAMADALIPQINWSEVEEPLMTGFDYQNYVEKNILNPLLEIPNKHKPEIDTMFQQLLSFEDGDLDILQFAQQLQARLKELGIEIDITPIIANEQEAKDKLQNSIEAIAEGGSSDFTTSSGTKVDADDYKLLQEYTKNFNEEQIELWNNATLGTENAADAIAKYEKALLSASNANQSDMSLTDTISELNTLKDKFDVLDKTFAKLQNSNEKISFEDYSSISEAFRDLSGIDTYIQKLQEAGQNEEAVKNAMSGLISAYINQTGILDNVNDENADLIANTLTEMGLENAHVIVMQQLSAAKEIAAIKTFDLTTATIDEIQALIQEGNISEQASNYILRYALKKELANGVTLTTNGDIANIISLVRALGGATDALTRFQAVKNGTPIEIKNPNFQKKHTGNNHVYLEGLYGVSSFEEDAQKEIDNVLNSFGDTDIPLHYNGGSATNDAVNDAAQAAKDAAETVQQAVAQTFDFIQNGLDLWERNMNRIKQVAENTYLSLTKRAKAYKDEIDGTAFGIQLLQKDYETYMAKANAVGLDENLAAAVRGGSSDIIDITDDNVKQQIQDYESWYDKAQDCLDQIEELKIQLTELKLEKIQLEIDVKADKLTRLESALDKIQGKIDLKETWGFQASVKDYTKMNANLSKQMANLNEQNTLIKQQQSLVEKGSEAWQDYQQSIDSNNASVQSLTQSMAENASALAAIAGEKAASKIEKYDASDELLQAKAENSNHYANQNSYIDSEIKNIGKRQSAYDAAVKTDKSGLKSASRTLTKTKATKGNKGLLKKIKSYVKSQKEIPSSVLTSAAQLDDNGSLYNKCVLYNAYLAAYETDKAAADLYRQTSRQEKADLASQKQANIAQYYENRQGVYTQRKNQIDAAINLTTAKGYRESAKYYQQLIKQEQNNNASLSEERQKLVNALAKSVENGSVKRYSDEWYELCQQIDDVTNAINESDLALVEYQNQMRQLSWDNFDALQNKIKNITSETDFIANLLSNEELSDSETGGLTDAGKATAYLHAANYQVYLQQARDYENELAKIGTELAKDPYNENLISRKEELVSAYQESISAAQEEKYAIIDLYEQGYEAMSDKISDLISEYEALLDAEKNAYDYQNQISEKTEKIAQLRKQLMAYEGDLSEEARAKIQSISVSLNEAEKDLQDTQYDKYISDTKDLLSDLQSNFNDLIQDVVDAMSDNLGQLISNINEASTNSASLITDYMAEVGYTPTDVFSAILANKSVVEGTEEAITTTKELQAKMTAYANSIAASLSVLTAKDEVNQKIQSDGANALKADANSAASKADSFRDEYSAVTVQRTNAASEKKEAKEKYQTAKEKYGANHTKTRKALEAYNAAKANYSAINDYYLSLKENYNNARLKSEVMAFLSEHLGIASGSRSDLSDLNKALYDTYGMRVLDATEVKELAKLLDISSTNQSSTGDLYTKLKELGINGFRVGSKNVSYGQLAILAEGGKELQFDKSRGVLREVGQGDKIFTEEMTENLWRLAQMNPDLWNSRQIPITVKAPTFEVNTQTQPVSVAVGDIIMNGVNDVETFGRQLREEICKNGKTTQCLTEAVASKIVHNGIGNARLYQ